MGEPGSGSNRDDNVTATNKQVIYIRPRLSTPGSDIACEGETLRAALLAAMERARTLRGTVDMRWEDGDAISVLDIDDLDLGGMALESFVSRLAVAPWLVWVSRSGEGIHCVYHSQAGFTARELAHCAALSAIEMGNAKDVEVMRRSAAPSGDVVEWGQPATPRVPVAWSESIDVSDDRVQAWLDERGLVAGQRFAHTKCPFNPEASTGAAPVAVYDERVYCFRCSRGATFTSLVAGRRPTLLVEAARNLVHWQHAQLIMSYEFPHRALVRDGFARSIYSALCKLIHGPSDMRLGGLFNPNLRLVRIPGAWADPSTLNGLQGHGKQIFNSFPTIQYVGVDKKGEEVIKIDPARAGLITSNAKLAGYAEVVPVRGVSLWRIWNEYPDDGRVRATIPSRSPFPARYIPPASRLSMEETWRTLEKSFPGLDRDYLQLLIVARIIAESGKGAVPMLAVTGATGTGKSATVTLAAELLHDEVKTIQPTVPLENFDKAFGQHAASSAGFIRLDEFAKNRPDDRAMEAFEPLLLIERTYDCTRLYVGQVRVPVQSAVIISRVSIPARVLDDPQVARRIVPYHLVASCPDWREASGGIEGWRDRNKDNALAADSLISWITDEFAGPDADPDFRAMAVKMGIEIASPQRADEPLQPDLIPLARAVADLYRAICSPEAIPARETARAERGWKIVRSGGTDPVSRAWESICDDPTSGWTSTRNIDAHNLADLCGFPEGTRIYAQERHGDLLVRFVEGQTQGRRPGPHNEHIHFRPRLELCDPTPPNSASGATTRDTGTPKAAPASAPSGNPAPASSSAPAPAARSSQTLIAADALESLWTSPPSAPAPAAVTASTSTPTSSAASGGTGTPSSRTTAQTTPASRTTVTAQSSSDALPSTPLISEDALQSLWNLTPMQTATADPAEIPKPDRLYIDLETRSVAELREIGGRSYALHPTTELVIGCAIANGHVYEWHHAEGVPGALPVGTLPPHVRAIVGSGVPLVAHNAEGFDQPVWERFYGAVPGGWIDTLKVARSAGLKQVDLGQIGVVFTGRGKDEDGKKFWLLYAKPRHGKEFATLTSDVIARAQQYCRRDAELLAELCEKKHLDLTGSTRLELEVMTVDRVINQRGIAVDARLARALLVMQDAVDAREGDRLFEATGGELTKADLTNPQKLRKWCAAHGLVLPDFRADTLEKVLNGAWGTGEDDESEVSTAVPPAVLDVIRARAGSASVVRSKAEAVLRDVNADGRVRGLFVYHAGRTGRWSSRGLQVHNFPRGEGILTVAEAEEFLDAILRDPYDAARRFTDPRYANALSDMMRGLLVSAPGKVLISADYSAIEARVLPWLCGDKAKVEAFRRGDPIYEQAAAQLFGVPVSQVTRKQRQVGKVRELGCGYQMGPKSLALFAAAQGVDLMAAGITPKMVVDSFRKANAIIKQAWPLLRNETMRVVMSREPRTVCRTQWEMSGRDLVATLPIGRKLRYREARIEKVVPAYKLAPDWKGDREPIDTLTFSEGDEESTRISTYGGKLSENLTQAASRDVLAESIVDLEHAGLPVVLHVHDSAACEIDEADADDAEHEMVTIMARDREWAPGLPLKVEVEVRGTRWMKGK